MTAREVIRSTSGGAKWYVRRPGEPLYDSAFA
jgi:hypothetical protein